MPRHRSRSVCRCRRSTTVEELEQDGFIKNVKYGGIWRKIWMLCNFTVTKERENFVKSRKNQERIWSRSCESSLEEKEHGRWAGKHYRDQEDLEIGPEVMNRCLEELEQDRSMSAVTSSPKRTLIGRQTLLRYRSTILPCFDVIVTSSREFTEFNDKINVKKAIDLYSAFLCTSKAGGQATSNALLSLTGGLRRPARPPPTACTHRPGQRPDRWPGSASQQ